MYQAIRDEEASARKMARRAQEVKRKVVVRGWRCVEGDPYAPRAHYYFPGAFRDGLQAGVWVPGSVWEHEGKRYVVEGALDAPQRARRREAGEDL
jgi:hypothetical protein